jgi:hypothetical protein
MKRVVTLLVLTSALVGLVAVGASARNTPRWHGSSPQAACGFGSCFVPNFNAAGDVAVYKGPAAARVEFADCCTAGDKYKVIAKGPSGSSTNVFTSSGTLNGDCSVGPYAGSGAAEVVGGATQVKYVAVALPGGAPASAYVRVSAGGWSQTKGTDSCGF